MPADRTIPEIIAHRGTPRERRENTLPAFANAIAQGADGIELDVHATADGVVIVHHDAMLPLGTQPAALAGRAIATLQARELADALLPTDPDGIAVGVPTLAEVMEAVGSRATLYVEIKAARIEPAVLDRLRCAQGRVAVHGFDHRVSRRVSLVPDAPPTGVLVYSYLLDPVHALRGAGARDYWCWWEFIDAATVDRIQAAGGRVVAWTVNDVAEARRLAALGVDALCTDLPGALRAALAEQG
jgi:glycerophosphoryl diester phosphodiesterase